MRASTAGSVLALALLLGCGASRSDQDATAVASAEATPGPDSCPVEVHNPTFHTLELTQAVRGVRGSIPLGRVEREGHYRFGARCSLGTVSVFGWLEAYGDRQLFAMGSAELVEGQLTTVELRRQFY